MGAANNINKMAESNMTAAARNGATRLSAAPLRMGAAQSERELSLMGRQSLYARAGRIGK